MQQTLIALGAMMIAMLFSMNQQQSIMLDQERMIHDELEMMAAGIALQTMEHIATRPFDRAVDESTFSFSNVKNSSFARWPFQSSDSTFASAAYLEDFHAKADTINFQAGDNLIPFAMSVYVHYIDGSKKHSATQTDTKEVIVSISHSRYKKPLVKLQRSFSP